MRNLEDQVGGVEQPELSPGGNASMQDMQEQDLDNEHEQNSALSLNLHINSSNGNDDMKTPHSTPNVSPNDAISSRVVLPVGFLAQDSQEDAP